MKRNLLLAAAITAAMSATLAGCNEEQASAAITTLDSAEQRVSYGMGISLGKRINQESFSIDVDAFNQGVKDVVTGGEQLMTEEEITEEMQAFQQRQVEKQQQEAKQVADTNLAEGEVFLAENASKEGVKTTESGLQYKIITVGEGAIPAASDTVEVHYAGTLIDGTEFDSSYQRGATVSFPVGGVIPGWTEALQLMPVGSKWQLFIPSALAYGPGGTGSGPIGPNATLIFDVELISIKDVEAAEG